MRATTSARERGQRVAAAAQELAYDLRVDDRAAGADLAQCRDELLDVGSAVLQQVADGPAVAGVEQVGGVGVLHVLAEHHHGKPRPGGAG
jgi:hypothetical protein